jgi:hypothetical protein
MGRFAKLGEPKMTAETTSCSILLQLQVQLAEMLYALKRTKHWMEKMGCKV